MAEFIFTPAAVRDPRNHPRRIYFSCHEADMIHFEEIAAQIRAIEEDCVIAYADPRGEVVQRLAALEDFHLTVIPVTESWFSEGSHTQEFHCLAAAHKPMLPILFRASLEERFNQSTDNLQFLRINDPDFSEKLRRTLRDILFDGKLLEDVRGVFTHKMFVSYCREDADQARRLIQCIHSEESGKRIAIWYDKYLPMGKNFEASIFEELDDCQFFAVTLTPSLLGRDNYVKTYEYPRAQTGGKKIIFFELTPVDREKLLAQMEGAGAYDCISPEASKAFGAFIRSLIEMTPGNHIQLSPAQTDYLLGLAYQNGLFVEFDHLYAAQKFKSAANAQHADAAHALANMFYHGLGITRDVEKAISWYKKEVRIIEREFKQAVEMLVKIKKIPAVVKDKQTGEISTFQDSIQILDTVVELVRQSIDDLVVRCCNNARILRDEGRMNGAEQLYRIALQALDLIDSVANRLGLGEKYRSRIKNEMRPMLIIQNKHDVADSEATWKECRKGYLADPKDPEKIHNLLHSAHNYGAELMYKNRFAEARQVMLQALEVLVDVDDPAVTENRPIYELELVLHRDVGRTYILCEPTSEEQRASNAQEAMCMFNSVVMLMEDVPFDLEENPYLYVKEPETRYYVGETYAYMGDHPNAYRSYLQAFQGYLNAESQLGDRVNTLDYPLMLLQGYARSLQALSGYDDKENAMVFWRIAESLFKRYSKHSFSAEHRPLAQNYLEILQQAKMNFLRNSQ